MTNPNDIPPDVARKIIAARDALLTDDALNEAWHQLYSIADPTFSSFTPWEILEERAKLP